MIYSYSSPHVDEQVVVASEGDNDVIQVCILYLNIVVRFTLKYVVRLIESAFCVNNCTSELLTPILTSAGQWLRAVQKVFLGSIHSLDPRAL